MRTYIVLTVAIICSLVTSSVAVALNAPSSANGNDGSQQLSRSKRDMNGVFDSISRGFTGFAGGINKVTDSMKNAFAGVFSESNKKHLDDGIQKFQKGIQDAVGGVFNSLSNGFKQVGNAVKGAFNPNGKNRGKKGTVAPSGNPEKSVTPQGGVPQEELT